MSKSKFQLWWSTDKGERIRQLDEVAFFNYARIVNGIGSLNIGLPYKKYGDLFRKDYRVEVLRRSFLKDDFRLEDIYLMQEAIIRTRQADNVTILDMTGENGMGILKRRIVKYLAGTAQASKTDFIDDMMKEIVDENFGAAAFADDADRAVAYNQGYFQVQADVSKGASVTKSFFGREVLAILKELSEISQQQSPKIYFDVIPQTNQIFQFQTFVNQRGGDRRFSAGKDAFYFSLERGNLEAPNYERDYFEEKNVVYVAGQGEESDREIVEREDTNRSRLSIWARNEMYRDARNETATAGLQDTGDEELGTHRPRQRFVANFLDAPASRYGIDWDFGDQATVFYAGQTIDIEIKMVYVTVDENGAEKIHGRNEFGAFTS